MPNVTERTVSTPIATPERLVSIDAYRGVVMFLMMTGIFQLSTVASLYSELPDASETWKNFWHFLALHWSHVPWTGCTLHDMIQPSFSFLVGVALPFSLAARIARGQTRWRMILHAFWRALVLVFLGVFLRSIGSSETCWTFEDTLSQIGLGYLFLFAIGWGSRRVQICAFLVILIGYWLSFALYPIGQNVTDTTTQEAKRGVSIDWKYDAQGFAAHWNKNDNVAWAFDRWFLNLFPRSTPFLCNGGGYSTLSFIPTLATMILGLLAGNLLRGGGGWIARCGWFVLWGVICIVAGCALDWSGLCPIAKRIWTPSWVLFSGGICLIAMCVFHLIADVAKWKIPFYPFVVIGANSIVAYCMADSGLHHFFSESLHTHFGDRWMFVAGAPYQILIQSSVILLIDWLILLWMYRRKVFVRI